MKAALSAAQGRPVVMVAVDFDPLARGYIQSLARPGGNVTGPYFQQIALTGKRLQLMMEAFPDMRAASVFWDRVSADQWRVLERAAKTLGLRVAGVELKKRPYDFEKALARAPSDHRGALIVTASPNFAQQGRAVLPDLALKHRMVSMFFIKSYVPAGGLMSYGPSITDLMARAAEYADRIAKGADPGDLPVEGPRRIELAINLKTAKALGVTFPQSILLRATKVIE